MKKKKSATGIVKEVVGAGVILGVGSTMLGAMGQGAIATQTITPAARMIGPLATAGMGMAVLDIVNTQTRRKKK